MFSKTARTSIHRPGQPLSVLLHAGSATSAAYAPSYHIQSHSSSFYRPFPPSGSVDIHSLDHQIPPQEMHSSIPQDKINHPSGTSELHYCFLFYASSSSEMTPIGNSQMTKQTKRKGDQQLFSILNPPVSTKQLTGWRTPVFCQGFK